MSSKKRIVASTKVYSDEYIYTWTIENYRLLKFEVGEKIESPKFGVGSDDKKYFQLLLYPEGDNAEDEGYISLYLTPLIDSKNKPDKLVCRWTLSAINDKNVVTERTLHYNFATSNFNGYGFPKFHKLENIDELISAKNTATFQCKLEIFKKYESSLKLDVINNEEQTIDKVNLDPLCLSEEFKLLSNSEEIKEIDDSIVWVNLMQSVVKSQKNVS
uniref:MATH domain-containing protein n=1 Tax=Trichogramma kaykai TaxID=54128 RepID=A0ABD2X6P2_9HYME